MNEINLLIPLFMAASLPHGVYLLCLNKCLSSVILAFQTDVLSPLESGPMSGLRRIVYSICRCVHVRCSTECLLVRGENPLRGFQW